LVCFVCGKKCGVLCVFGCFAALSIENFIVGAMEKPVSTNAENICDEKMRKILSFVQQGEVAGT
jgi:hypothetical protein